MRKRPTNPLPFCYWRVIKITYTNFVPSTLIQNFMAIGNGVCSHNRQMDKQMNYEQHHFRIHWSPQSAELPWSRVLISQKLAHQSLLVTEPNGHKSKQTQNLTLKKKISVTITSNDCIAHSCWLLSILSYFSNNHTILQSDHPIRIDSFEYGFHKNRLSNGWLNTKLAFLLN